MKINIDKNRLSLKLWEYFMVFALSIVGLLWLLQIVFMNSFYETMKIREITKIGNNLVEMYKTEDFQEELISLSFKQGIVINILDEYGNLIYPLDIFDIIKQPRLNEKLFNDFLSRLYLSNNNYVAYVVEDERLDESTIIYGAILENDDGSNYFLYINSMLQPVDSTTNILKNQLIMVTFIALILSLGLSLVISKKLSKPIEKITDLSKELALGNYDIEFDKGEYTEISNLANTLNIATKELSKSEELRRDFLANVTHDLKTPLTVIKSYGELIRDISGKDDVKREKNINIIIEETDKLSKLVDDLLELTKLQAGLSKLDLEVFDLSDLAENVADRFKYFVEEQGYRISIEKSGDTKVYADKMKIQQVIYNLINNAINYTLEDKLITIKIEEKNENVVLSVIDRGQGIDKDEINYIWERYYRSGKSHIREKSGSGIGLSMVKSIILAHNGEYGVESEIGKGSRFYFKLKRYANVKD
ncbi:sensor histidine kinase [Soehngenia longivitae]|uniref:histidine kinase n=2 Tax=Soehngenia longivitae TaxID=2562294 RepID=A0A4Z0D7B2_9FIRM|nr:sensor histidine kinase [Soehngenia longivitae]